MANKQNTANQKVCDWAEGSELERIYHDEEWGVPNYDDHRFFEFLILESMQAGLSWRTILEKRENFRVAFADFNVGEVALFDEAKVAELLQNPGIIRNRLKIKAAINNAQRFLEVAAEWGSFSNYLWHFVSGEPIQNHWQTLAEVPAETPLSGEICQDLKKRGFKFIGPTIVYAYLQSMGLVNDHLVNCPCYQQPLRK